MTFFSDIFSSELIHALGAALLNSIWQGAAVALVLWAILSLPKKLLSSSIRYSLSFGSLFVVLAAFIRTFLDKYSLQNSSAIQNNSWILFENTVSTGSEHNIPVEGGSGVLKDVINNFTGFWSGNSEYIVIIWFVGMIILALKLTGGLAYLLHLKSLHEPDLINIDYKNRVKLLASKLAITKNVNVIISRKINAASLIGYFKPVILLPAQMITGFPQAQIDLIIMHELVHLKRADYYLNLIQIIIEIVFFFNPAVKWISKKINDERENFCDDQVLELTGERDLYINTLIQSAQFQIGNYAAAQTLFKNDQQLYRRINRMTGGKQKPNITFLTAAFLSFFLILGAFAACSSNGEFERAKPDGEVAKVTFYDRNADSSNEIEAEIEDGEITDITVDGEEVPDKERKLYEKKIECKLKKMKNKKKINFSELNLGEALSGLKALEDLEFHFDFDEDKFNDKMEQLAEKLSRMEIMFEPDSISGKKIHINIPNLEFDFNGIDIDFDEEAFERSMEKLEEKLDKIEFTMGDIDIDFDFSELNLNLEKLSEKLNNLDIDLSGLEEELEKLESFVNEMKAELIADGYLEDFDDCCELELSANRMVVNGREIPEAQLDKYLDMYREHFGKDIEKDAVFKLHN